MTVVKYRWIFGVICVSFFCDVFGIETGTSLGRNVDSSNEQGLSSESFMDNMTRKNGTTENQSSDSSVTTNDVTHGSTITPNIGESMKMQNNTTSRLSKTTRKYKLPQSWSNFCTVAEDEIYESEFTPKTNLTSIKCIIDSENSGIWTIVDLRKNFELYKDLNLNFSVEIECLSRANISLSWPFKVNSLFVLKVQGCMILDFLAEQNEEVIETTPDSLRTVRLWNTMNTVLLSRLMETTSNIRNVKKEFDCIHVETIEEISTRNVSFDFIIDNELLLTQLLERGQDFVLNTRRIPHVCDYPHLRVLDESSSDSRSLYHMDLMTDNAIYEALRIYNASHTYIKVLKDQYLQWSMTFPNLEMLDLSHNDISKLYRFALPLHTSLDIVTTIDLTYNRISTITVADLERFKQMPMVFFDLRHNPIDCNCSDTLEELIRYIKDEKHLQISNLSDYSYIENLACKNPENLEGMTLKSLTTDMICESKVQTEYFLVPIICLSAAIVVLALLLFTVLRFRQEITIILFTRFNIIIPCQTRENYDSEKKYDAFVSYSSNEEEYVEKLFEDLEKQPDDKSRPSFKFCMHHRDFVPGRTIFDNVTFSVESSRHTIILLSNHFIKSEYCLYEFQEAFRQSIMEKRRHLVIIMMEDIPEEKLPRDLRRCVKTFTYIRKDDFLFTERLIFALSIKHRGKTVLKSKTNTSEKDKSDHSIDIYTKSKPVKSENNIEGLISPKNRIHLETELKQSEIEGNQAFKTIMSDHIEFRDPSKSKNIERQNKYRKNGDKLNLSIKHTNDFNLSPVERKLNNKDLEYDRSLSLISQDTGYGSDMGSICERLSPEVAVDIEAFPDEVIC
ncbi:toll-like receptor 2 type-2 [Mercenaria mercenaria]|uniref:toll-like receptor 2 type-2 n=1 Tax=Mercenaria mercenaria TaxID=6596 RepID=UPI001E1D658C|nr:toll-like receptor 2 type-2 [Mercenaria mercenaria]